MLKFLILLTLSHYSLAIDPSSVLFQEVFTYHNETYTRGVLASAVVDIIYNSFHQWFFTVTFCEFTYFENRILKYIETYNYGYPVMLLNGCPDDNRTKVKPRYNRHGNTAYVVTSNELNLDVSESVIYALKKTGIFKPRSAVIFVIKYPVIPDKYFYFALKNHFQLLWSRSITNSVLLLWSDKLRMYTYNPFFNEVKDITSVKDVSRVLTRQYVNLYGYKLRLSVFRKIYTSDETGPIYCDSKLAKTVIDIMNATCIPLVPRDGNTVGDLLENGTATGVTSDLMDGYSDLELNSRILKNSYYGYIDTTYPLIQDELCFLIKKSTKQSTFMTALKLISIKMLSVFIFNVILFLVITPIARKVESIVWNFNDKQTAGTTVMDLLKCLFRQTVDFKFWGPVFRSLVLIIIMYSLIVDCAIDGILTSAITYPRFKPDIDVMADLIYNTNMTFGIHNRHVRIFNRSINDEYYAAIKNRVEIFNDQKIKEVVDKREYQYATLLRKSDAQLISTKPKNMNNGRPLFHVVADCPVPCSIVYGLRYGSPYLPRLNNILHHLNQAGILQYWNLDWSASADHSLHHNIYASDNKERKALNSSNLQEVFFVLLFGYLISIIAFVFEILVNAFSNSRKLSYLEFFLKTFIC